MQLDDSPWLNNSWKCLKLIVNSYHWQSSKVIRGWLRLISPDLELMSDEGMDGMERLSLVVVSLRAPSVLINEEVLANISADFSILVSIIVWHSWICGLMNSMQWGWQLFIFFTVFLQTNANKMKFTIVLPSYPSLLPNLLPRLWVTCSVYATFTTLIKTGSLAKLVLLTWMHLRIAHQTQSTQPGLSHKDVHKSFQSVMERSV